MLKSQIALSIFYLFFYFCAVIPEVQCKEKPSLIYVSWGDEIIVGDGDGKLDSPQKIAKMMKFWAESFNAQIILWRVDDYILTHHYKWNNPNHSYLKRSAEINKQFDSFKVAVEEAHKNGMKILAYATIWDLGAPPDEKYQDRHPFPWQSFFSIEHPYYQVIDKNGRKYQSGVFELAYPETRNYLLSRIDEVIKKYAFDGVYWCTRTHSAPAENGDQFGYSKPVAAEFEKRYGKNILNEDFDIEKWRRLRGEYLLYFFREAKKMWPDKSSAIGIPRGRYIGPPYGNMYIDWETLAEEKLVDRIVLGVNSGAWLYPARSTDYKKLGYLCADEFDYNVPGWDEAVNKVYGPLCAESKVKLSVNSSDPKIEAMEYVDSMMLDCPVPIEGTTRIPHYKELNCENGLMTIEFWTCPLQFGYTLNSTKRIISKYGNQNNAQRGFEVNITSLGNIEFRVQTMTPYNSHIIRSKTALPLKKWTHVACVADAKNKKFRIFINGKLDAEINVDFKNLQVNPEIDMYIGRYGNFNDFNYNGLLDELVIWNEARYYDGVPEKPYSKDDLKKVVAAFDFDSADGSVIINLSDFRINAEVIKESGKPNINPSLVESMKHFGKALVVRTYDLK